VAELFTRAAWSESKVSCRRGCWWVAAKGAVELGVRGDVELDVLWLAVTERRLQQRVAHDTVVEELLESMETGIAAAVLVQRGHAVRLDIVASNAQVTRLASDAGRVSDDASREAMTGVLPANS
jgi:hypothetical protein